MNLKELSVNVKIIREMLELVERRLDLLGNAPDTGKPGTVCYHETNKLVLREDRRKR